MERSPGPRVMLTGRVEPALMDRATARAAELGITRSDLIRDAIVRHLDRLETRDRPQAKRK